MTLKQADHHAARGAARQASLYDGWSAPLVRWVRRAASRLTARVSRRVS